MDSAIFTFSSLGLAASIGWLLLVLVQRLYWSPLAKVPGPWLAAATYWYEFYFNVIQPGRYIFKIQELHKQYGPIIRVTPNEVHVNDIEFLEQVYPTSHLREREKYLKSIGVGMHLSTAVTASHQMHKLRRDAIGPYFSHRSVVEDEPMLKSKMVQYRRYLNDAMDGRVVNFNDVHFALSRDIVFQYCFQRECNLLEDLEQVAIMRKNANGLALGVHVVVQLPWFMKLLAFLSIFLGDRLTPAGALNLKALGRSISPDIRKALDGPPPDDKTKNVLEVLREHDECQRPDQLPQRLAEEGIFIILAGTESTNKTLSIAVFYMAWKKEIMSKLRAELDPLGTEPSLKQLGNAQYLNAVIQEANRLAFGLPGRVTARVAPSEVIHYNGYAIPPGTAFGTTTLCAHTNPDVFPDPWEFQPERWMGEAGKRRQKYQMGFGRGNRKCLGMNLANAEMQLAISNLIQHDIELFETDLSDVLIQHEYQVATAKLDSAGIRGKLSKRSS